MSLIRDPDDTKEERPTFDPLHMIAVLFRTPPLNSLKVFLDRWRIKLGLLS